MDREYFAVNDGSTDYSATESDATDSSEITVYSDDQLNSDGWDDDDLDADLNIPEMKEETWAEMISIEKYDYVVGREIHEEDLETKIELSPFYTQGLCVQIP